MSETVPTANRCRFCGCTDLDCSRCFDVTGARCYWIEEDLCSACLGCAFVVLREQFRELLDVLGAFGRSGTKALPMFGGLSAEVERIASELPELHPRMPSDFLGGFVVGEETRLAADESLEFPPSAGSELGNLKVGDPLEAQPDHVLKPGPGVRGPCPKCGIVDHRAVSCDEARGRVAGELVAGEALERGPTTFPASEVAAAADQVAEIAVDACRAAGYVVGGRVRERDFGNRIRRDGTIVSAARDEVLVRWEGDDRALSPDAYSLSSAIELLEVLP